MAYTIKDLSEDFLTNNVSEINYIEKEVNQILDNKDAEISSLSKEREELLKEKEKLEADLKETKTLNFTLARRVNAAPKKSFEETLAEMMGVK